MEALDTLQLVFGSTLFYLGLHALAAAVMVPRLDRKKLTRLSETDRIEVPEKIPSMVNGVIVGFLAFWLVFVENAFDADTFGAWPPALDFFFSNMIGYTIYDLSVMIRQPKVPLDIWAHHVLGFAGCVGMLYFRKAAFIPVAFGMTELTVVPHNLLWLLRRFGREGSSAHKTALAVRAILFLAVRLPMLPFAVWYSYAHQGPVPAALSASPWASYMEKWRATGPIVFYGTAVNAIVFGLLNTAWTLVITQNALAALVLRKKKPVDARE